jgi:hypothetical protein
MRTDEFDQQNLRAELNSLGLENHAYVKTVIVDGQKLHAVFAADGTPLTVVNQRELAFATMLQHELEVLSVH